MLQIKITILCTKCNCPNYLQKTKCQRRPADLKDERLLRKPFWPRPPEGNDNTGILKPLVPQKIQLFASSEEAGMFNTQSAIQINI